MKVVVTGATGFLGAHLVRKLALRGAEVHCIIRKPNALVCEETVARLGLHLHTIPLIDHRVEVEALTRVMDGAEFVYHLAGVFDPSPGGVERMVALHVFGTRALLKAAERASVRRFVHCSSSITVPFGPKSAPATEAGWFDPTPIYGAEGALRGYYNTKLQSEDLVLGWQGMECVVVNPDYIIGALDVKPTSGQLILSMAKHPVWFYPLGGKCFLGAEDCADAHIAAVEQGRSGERYLLGWENLSYRELMSMIADVVGCSAPKIPIPYRVMKLAASVGKVANRFDAHRFAGLEPRVLLSMQQERYRNGSKMCRELGIKPKPMYESIEAAYRWFCDQGYC